LQRVDYENRKVVCYECAERRADFASLEEKGRRNRAEQLESERADATPEHSDSPAARDVFRRRLFADDFIVKIFEFFLKKSHFSMLF